MGELSERNGAVPVILMLHAAFFSYQCAYSRIVGSASRALLNIAIPYLREVLTHLNVPDFVAVSGIEVKTSLFAEALKDSGYVREVAFSREGPSDYVFEVRGCKFAAEGHKVFSGGCFTCPFAVLAAAILLEGTSQDVSMGASSFSEDSSRTQIYVRDRLAGNVNAV